jgi:hypothetical protein
VIASPSALCPRFPVFSTEGYTHDLQLDGLAVELNSPDLEVHADCGDVALSVGVVGETEQKA